LLGFARFNSKNKDFVMRPNVLPVIVDGASFFSQLLELFEEVARFFQPISVLVFVTHQLDRNVISQLRIAQEKVF